MKLYHVTDKRSIHLIKKLGIKPQIGDRSMMVNEKEPAIYLCSFDSIQYWRIILGLDAAVIEVNDDSVSDKRAYSYGGKLYDEFIHFKHISKDNIRVMDSNEWDTKESYEEAMKNLCYACISSLSSFCVSCIRYYNRVFNNGSCHTDDDKSINILTIRANSIIKSYANILDYSLLSKEDIIKYLVSEGDSGEYTICDKYGNTNKRLYQMLIEYPKDGFYDTRKEIYDYIVKTFDGCLETDTGGYIPEEENYVWKEI